MTDIIKEPVRSKVKLICNQCGKVFYVHPYRKHTALFCSTKCNCDSRKKRVSCVCTNCGKEFERIKSQYNPNRNQFCSKKCQIEFGRINLICSFCGREYNIKKTRLDKNTINNYCSNKCKTEALKTKIKKVCPICGKDFFIQPHQMKKGYGIYCSSECYGKWMSSNIKGENHPQWQGGISFEPYCILFNNKFKERVREFFDNKCVICDKTKEENGRALCVHHVNYDKETCCNDSERLFVPLCRSCHSKTNSHREYWQEYFTQLINKKYDGKCYYTQEEYNAINPA